MGAEAMLLAKSGMIWREVSYTASAYPDSRQIKIGCENKVLRYFVDNTHIPYQRPP